MDRLHVQEECLMHRFFADPERRTEDGVYLSAEDARHAATVLRLRPGQQVQVFLDGQLLDATERMKNIEYNTYLIEKMRVNSPAAAQRERPTP